jgi:SAM-dependent methyltransferase
MRWLREAGINVRGVDINPELVRAARADGLDCMTVEEFAATGDRYDAMLMAHIVEHFAPAQLLTFLDTYLDRLKPGGYLILATPVLWSRFYNDFDHVKPYTPQAIAAVFSDESSQVQYHSRNRIELIDVGLRRIVRDRPTLERDYIRRHGRWFDRLALRAIRLCRGLAFRLTGGRVAGETNGWIGLYRKLDTVVTRSRQAA